MLRNMERSDPLASTGYIQVHAYTSRARLPLEDVAITVTASDGTAIAMRLTDKSGKITPIPIPVPDISAGQSPDTGEIPYTAVNLYAGKRGFEQIENEFAGCGYGKFKPVVGDAVIEHLRPIREEASRLLKDKAYLEGVYRDGAQKASYVAEKTLRKVYKKVGFVAK
jgi:hypothetical protein